MQGNFYIYGWFGMNFLESVHICVHMKII